MTASLKWQCHQTTVTRPYFDIQTIFLGIWSPITKTMEMIMGPSCLHNGNSYNGKTASLYYWHSPKCLTHWGWVRHICLSKINIIGSDNGLSPGWCQAIIWTNTGILLSGSLGTNFSEILIEIHTFSFKKMQLKMLSAEQWPFCLRLNVLMLLPEYNKQWRTIRFRFIYPKHKDR